MRSFTCQRRSSCAAARSACMGCPLRIGVLVVVGFGARHSCCTKCIKCVYTHFCAHAVRLMQASRIHKCFTFGCVRVRALTIWLSATTASPFSVPMRRVQFTHIFIAVLIEFIQYCNTPSPSPCAAEQSDRAKRTFAWHFSPRSAHVAIKSAAPSSSNWANVY